MRLLNTSSIILEDFLGDIPQYAILSHTWEQEEVLYADIQNRTARSKKGYTKILGCCRKAAEQGLGYAWIDTCCIDKTSSAELTEAINSMYQWYQSSTVCYAYLQDVTGRDVGYEASTLAIADFLKSRWFTRGWTLQELLAPPTVEFYTCEWDEIGTKGSLASKISRGTSIPTSILRGERPSTCSVAQRMSWASGRRTTRQEDIAYCLLGLFNINMPLLYGEGVKSFFRLQEQILRQEEDYSILSWTLQQDPGQALTGILASSPLEFSKFVPQNLQPPTLERDIPRLEKASDVDSRGRFQGNEFLKSHTFSTQFGLMDTTYNVLFRKDYDRIQRGDQSCPIEFAPPRPPEVTSRGISISLPLLQPKDSKNPALAWLYSEIDEQLVCIGLKSNPNTSTSTIKYGRHSSPWLITIPKSTLSQFSMQSFLIYPTGIISQGTEPSSALRPASLGRLRVITPPMTDYATYVVAAYPARRWSLDEFFFYGEPYFIGVVILECAYKDQIGRFRVFCGLRNGQPWCSISEANHSLIDEEIEDLEVFWKNFSINGDAQFLESTDRAAEYSYKMMGTLFTAAIRKGASQANGSATYVLHTGAYSSAEQPSWVDLHVESL